VSSDRITGNSPRRTPPPEKEGRPVPQELAGLLRENEALTAQLALAREEATRLAKELENVRRSAYWKIMIRFTSQSWLKRAWLVIPERTRHGIKGILSGSSPPQDLPAADEGTGPQGASADRPLKAPDVVPNTPAARHSGGSRIRSAPVVTMNWSEVPEKLLSFFQWADRQSVPEIVMFVSGVKFLDNEGQRSTQMARELLAAGNIVLMVYFRWPNECSDPVPVARDPRIFQLPLDLLDICRKTILSFDFQGNARRTCLIEFPHPETFQLVNELNATGWHTVYDIIDDWEEFHREGAAPWYVAGIEEYLCHNVGSLTAVVPALVDKVNAKYPDRHVHLVPNGVSPETFDRSSSPLPLETGDLTVGYFGYLSDAWFDWDLLLDTAEERPNWVFHIIGYGNHPVREIPANVHLHGKVNHERLYSYAASWDVGVVPFKESNLSRGADPIKVYEYLAMGLPVVVTGIPHLGGYPGVLVAPSREEFMKTLETASSIPFPVDRVATFLESCTWQQRALALLECPADGDLLTWCKPVPFGGPR